VEDMHLADSHTLVVPEEDRPQAAEADMHPVEEDRPLVVEVGMHQVAEADMHPAEAGRLLAVMVDIRSALADRLRYWVKSMVSRQTMDMGQMVDTPFFPLFVIFTTLHSPAAQNRQYIDKNLCL
jgi:hypothetical protein